MQPKTFGRKPSASDDIARKRAAFVASERARADNPAPRPAMRPMSPVESMQIAAQRLPERTAPEKSLLIAYLLWFLLGQISAHRFYLGAYRSAIVQASCVFGGAVIIIFETYSKSPSGILFGLIPMIVGLIWLFFDLFLMPGIKARIESQTQRRDYSAVFA